MVFISVVAGKEQIFRMGMDGSNPQQLTHDDADHEDPAWSPDGNHIAFVLKKGDLEQIQVMNADGSQVEPLNKRDSHHPSQLVPGQPQRCLLYQRRHPSSAKGVRGNLFH